MPSITPPIRPTLLRIPTLLATVMLGPACDADPSEAEQREQFEDAYDGLASQYGGDGKADIFDNLGVDVCRLVEPLYDNAEPFLRAGLVVGGEVEITVGARTGTFGQDWVWDIYHHQMSVSRYFGRGLTSAAATAGGGVGVYVGAAFNFEHGVSDWDGFFVSAGSSVGLELELPFMAGVDVEATPAIFVTAQDQNDNGRIDGPSEVIYPDGVYGFQVGVSGGASVAPIPDPLPFIEGSVSLSSGLWEPYDEGIRDAYDRLEDQKIALWFDLKVALVDHHTGEDCLEINPEWPYEPPGYSGKHLSCVLEFGDPDDGHLERAVHTAASMCELTGDCALPLAWPLSTAALAVGWANDNPGKVRDRCDL